MKFIFILVTFILAKSLTTQQDKFLGKWKTIDDTDGKTKSIVELYLKSNKLCGKVIELLPEATSSICNNCPGDKAGKSLLDMDIIWNMEPKDQLWKGGQIIDPKDGKVYSCLISLENQDLLKVRGYIGFPLFGRSQFWQRVK